MNITLAKAIERDGETIQALTLREPTAGDLRGVSLLQVGQMDVTALEPLLNRIATPRLTTKEFAALPAADVMAMMMAVHDFFDIAPSPTT